MIDNDSNCCLCESPPAASPRSLDSTTDQPIIRVTPKQYIFRGTIILFRTYETRMILIISCICEARILTNH